MSDYVDRYLSRMKSGKRYGTVSEHGIWKAKAGFGNLTKAAAVKRAREMNSRRNPPSGWIPASAVKIEKRNGAVKVRIKRR